MMTTIQEHVGHQCPRFIFKKLSYIGVISIINIIIIQFITGIHFKKHCKSV